MISVEQFKRMVPFDDCIYIVLSNTVLAFGMFRRVSDLLLQEVKPYLNCHARGFVTVQHMKITTENYMVSNNLCFTHTATYLEPSTVGNIVHQMVIRLPLSAASCHSLVDSPREGPVAWRRTPNLKPHPRLESCNFCKRPVFNIRVPD